MICFLTIPLTVLTQTISIDSLTLDRAITLALENHPSLLVADANLRSATAGASQALSSYFPNINATASATRTDGWFVFNPAFAPRKQSYDNYTAGIQASQMIFDFGRTINRVSANNRFEDASEADLQSARGTVITNVQLSYYGVIQAVQVAKVNEEAIERATQHLIQAKAFYSVGKRAQFDVTRAEVDLANANVNAIRSRNQLRLAKLQLENTMGIHSQSAYRISEVFDVEPFQFSLDSIKSITLNQRSELVAAQARVEANRSLATAVWDQHLPTLSASGNYTWTNFTFPLYSRWNAGITLSLPIFQGMGISAQVEQARATADAAEANLKQFKESIMLEVEQYYLSMKEAEERIAAASKLVEQAEQSLTLAEKQYAAGISTTIEVTDAQLTLSNARITKIQALYDYNSFLARLKRAMSVTR
jgi:TolC family type I secretion outer membrane protein